MSDIALEFSNTGFDIAISKGDLKGDAGLETAVAISLFTDKRVTDEELPQGADSKRGWWGDMVLEVDGDQIGSRLWTLERAKKVNETLRLAEDYAKEALNWLIEDGVADSIEVTAQFDETIRAGGWRLNVNIVRPQGNNTRYEVAWNAQAIKRI